MSGRRSIYLGLTILLLVLAWELLVFLRSDEDASSLRSAEHLETNEEADQPAFVRRTSAEDAAPMASTGVVADVASQSRDQLRLEIRHNEDGRPMPGAEVFVCPRDEQALLPRDADTRGLESILRHVATHHLADDEGNCVIPRPERNATIYAFTRTASAVLRNQGDFSGERRTLLLCDDWASFRVRTLGHDGRVLGDIPIALYHTRMMGSARVVGRTDEETGELLIRFPTSDRRPEMWRVTVGGALTSEVESDLPEIPAPGMEPALVELRLPPFGSLLLDLVDAGGRNIAFPVEVICVATGGEGHSTKTASFRTTDGKVMIKPLSLGTQLQYSFNPDDPADCKSAGGQLAGPTRDGEILYQRHRVEAWPRSMTFRVIDSEGRPLQGRDFSLHIKERSLDMFPQLSSSLVRSDGDGRCQLGVAGDVDLGGGVIEIKSMTSFADEGSIEFTIPMALGQLPMIDLGEIQLQPPPLICSGRVIDDQRRPIANARIELRDRSLGSWAMLHPKFGKRSRADGTFTLRGEIGGSELSLHVLAGDRYSSPRAFKMGDTGIEVVIASVPIVKGRLRLPPGLLRGDFALMRVKKSGDESPVWVDQNGQFVAECPNDEIERLELRIANEKEMGTQIIARDLRFDSAREIDLGDLPVTLEARRVAFEFVGLDHSQPIDVVDPGPGDDFYPIDPAGGLRRMTLTLPHLPCDLVFMRGNQRSKAIRVSGFATTIDLSQLDFGD